MDALRSLAGVRTAAPPQPPVAPVSVAPPPIQAQQPRGDRQGAATGGEVRGDEAGTRPEAEDWKQGIWVLQMLRVQPKWVDAADAETGGGGGGRGQEDDDPDIVGGERCTSCGGGGEEEGCPAGTGEYDGEVFDRASFSRLHRKVSRMPRSTPGFPTSATSPIIAALQPKCLRRYSLQFVITSVQGNEIANHDRKLEQSTKKVESPDKNSEVVKNAALGSKGEKKMSSAASYLHSRAMGVNPFGSRSNGNNDPTIMAIVDGENREGLTLDEASFVATTNSVTSMVVAKE